jgi:hypothetical protein
MPEMMLENSKESRLVKSSGCGGEAARDGGLGAISRDSGNVFIS